jgi:hypothetical protein
VTESDGGCLCADDEHREARLLVLFENCSAFLEIAPFARMRLPADRVIVRAAKRREPTLFATASRTEKQQSSRYQRRAFAAAQVPMR